MSFETQFNSFYPTLKQIARRFSETTRIPYEEFESSLCEEFFTKYDSFDPKKRNNFSAFMRVVLTQRAIRVTKRKEGIYYENVGYIEDLKSEDDEDGQVDFKDDYDLEDDLIRRSEIKTDADKRQLINALVRDSDQTTINIVREVLAGTDAKPTAIGKALGIHHQTVTRKLKYLSRKFDESIFGEIDTYLVCV